MNSLEEYFHPFYEEIIGQKETFHSPYGKKTILYADWTASGRLYAPIEEKISYQFGPFVANTHTESNITGKMMTVFYKEARDIIKSHVHADDTYALLLEGKGMTGALCKLQRILGLSFHEGIKQTLSLPEKERPVVFITHMEHHSNQTSWEETIADVVIIPPDDRGQVCTSSLSQRLSEFNDRPLKIGAFTACSNVTGIQTDYHHLAKIMHQHGGLCFVDFSASAPYVAMDVKPKNPAEKLDAIFFSPHKFLGGPSSTGIAIFSKHLYANSIPDHPGGGTVNWTNPWGEKSYLQDIEAREDGGTPGFLQAIRTALAIKLKEKMDIDKIEKRENELVHLLFERLEENKRVIILEGQYKTRLPILSFYVEGIHHNLFVKLLNDVHGVQARGGCACAGTYGHYLLKIGLSQSKQITAEVDKGNTFIKPGWVRISLHPTMKNLEVHYIADSIFDIIENIETYQRDYMYDEEIGEFRHRVKDSYVWGGDWFEV
ncbi:aminotransferase class V-fold PLP-dependent enzyme [Bacillus salitolerans]|uniref:Aminotransferase class V-fold PLP-dependent enzyme n=1 Tax=Bacillus salitolerans TaxID=1437434 RepID=A0ABW4LX57_9BACI